MKSAVQGIIFDLDGTLFDHDSAVRAALRDWLPSFEDATDALDMVPGFRRQSLPLDELTELWFVLEDKHFPAFLAGEIGAAEHRRRRLRDLLATIAVTPTASELDAHFADYLASYEANWRVFADVLQCLRRIKRRGLAVAVLTNGSQSQQVAKVRATKIDGQCGPVFASEGVGSAKPDPTSYLLVCERIGTDPDTTVMVGDNYELDVRGARAAGLRAVHLDRRGVARIPDPTRIATLAELDLDDPRLGVG